MLVDGSVFTVCHHSRQTYFSSRLFTVSYTKNPHNISCYSVCFSMLCATYFSQGTAFLWQLFVNMLVLRTWVVLKNRVMVCLNIVYPDGSKTKISWHVENHMFLEVKMLARLAFRKKIQILYNIQYCTVFLYKSETCESLPHTFFYVLFTN